MSETESEEIEEIEEVEEEVSESDEQMEVDEDPQEEPALEIVVEMNTPFLFLKREALEQEQQKLVKSLMSELYINHDDACTILMQFMWKKDRLMDEYFKDVDKFGIAYGIVPRAEETLGTDDSEMTTCPICYEDYPLRDMIHLICNHVFCRPCFTGHVINAFEQGHTCISTRCPMDGCNLIIPQSLFESFLNISDATKYHHYWQANYIESMHDLSYCTRPDCLYVAQKKQLINDVVCPCGTRYCFRCHRDAHSPCTCIMVEDWDALVQKNSENYNWIRQNTKPCPGCKRPIEKNKGCNYMRCAKCQYEFCWVCLHSWKTHNDHFTCVTPPDKIKKLDADNGPMLDYGQHYHDHWIEEKKSLEFAVKQKTEVKSRREEYCRLTKQAFAESFFVGDAVDLLIDARSMLMNSYIFAYYSRDKKELFEWYQGDLQAQTEKLSFETERPVAEIERFKMVILVNQTRDFLDRLKSLFQGGKIDL
ncbi:putative E3 ubiquitin-protein ligase dbl4 [Blattamonas nauphoetae]|uniref:RBR-type E3 ubiquitin transferase n=1 Tax=Blattamonas nauphoetae TaxID=2049346 RepID=A0ABQ9Y5U1_9EUKA|nr:putative E3 ubiquitin-protein ligase dbl4 [Blattamonas nauphoetae]